MLINGICRSQKEMGSDMEIPGNIAEVLKMAVIYFQTSV